MQYEGIGWGQLFLHEDGHAWNATLRLLPPLKHGTLGVEGEPDLRQGRLDLVEIRDLHA